MGLPLVSPHLLSHNLDIGIGLGHTVSCSRYNTLGSFRLTFLPKEGVEPFFALRVAEFNALVFNAFL